MKELHTTRIETASGSEIFISATSEIKLMNYLKTRLAIKTPDSNNIHLTVLRSRKEDRKEAQL